MALDLVINGQGRTFEELVAGASVSDLVAALGLKSDRVALELNGEIAARRNWEAAFLADGDKIEVVHFVGGGTFGCGAGSDEASQRDQVSRPSERMAD